jgi:hypothetical protein
MGNRMGIYFNGLFAIKLPLAPPTELIHRFELIGAPMDGIVERWRQFWQPQAWAMRAHDPPKDPQLIDIVGPGGFWISISPAAAQIYHCSKWTLFLWDRVHREALRRACFEIARILGSERAVYLPELTDSGFHEMKSLDQMEQRLVSQFGPPAPSIDAIAEAESPDYWFPNCYYIDLFPDMQR